MSRTIKFRAWAIASKEMFYPDEEDRWTLFRGEIKGPPNTVLMQYTGLKDKNGKEIYEGDYLRDDSSEPLLHRIVWNEDDARYDVEWWEGGDDFEEHDENWQGIGDIVRNLEVIGNIYENPDYDECADCGAVCECPSFYGGECRATHTLPV